MVGRNGRRLADQVGEDGRAVAGRLIRDQRTKRPRLATGTVLRRGRASHPDVKQRITPKNSARGIGAMARQYRPAIHRRGGLSGATLKSLFHGRPESSRAWRHSIPAPEIAQDGDRAHPWHARPLPKARHDPLVPGFVFGAPRPPPGCLAKPLERLYTAIPVRCGHSADTAPFRRTGNLSLSANRLVSLVRTAGVEPARGCPQGILSPLRLPIPPRPRGELLASASRGPEARDGHAPPSRNGGWKASPVSQGKWIQVSCDTSVMKVSTSGRPIGLA
jgi:hypothetical protein